MKKDATALKPAETCMAAWACAVRKPRERPAWWPSEDEDDGEGTTTMTVNGVTFSTGREFRLHEEKKDDDDDDMVVEDPNKNKNPTPFVPSTVEDALFEIIAEARSGERGDRTSSR